MKYKHLIVIISAIISAQTMYALGIISYLSPLPNSKNNDINSEIIIKFLDKIDANSINDKTFEVKGELSGFHDDPATFHRRFLRLR
ncbi:MAG: hypothetical protein HZB41_04620 [Ignavibacteriae bacterium]|nr:hypothetical protein [Ignavibacteriota bacterium]